MHNSISQNGFSLVLLISSIQTVKGLTGQPSVASGNPPEKIVRLEAPTPTLSLPQRRLLFTTKVAFHLSPKPGWFAFLRILTLIANYPSSFFFTLL